MTVSTRLKVRAIVVVAILGATLAIPVAPASAVGTLTSISGSTWDSFTGATNVRESFVFTSATTATLARVTCSTPAGTDVGNHYLALNGISGNYASTPDSVANSITGDIDIRVKLAPPSWTPASTSMMVAKAQSAGQLSYEFYVKTTGAIELDTTADGSTVLGAASTSSTGFSAGSTNWVRATLQVNDGSGHRVETYYTSPDGSTWTQLGTTITTGGTTSIFDSTSVVEIGTSAGGTANMVNGKVYAAQIYSGIGGTLKNSFDPTLATPSSPSTWTASTGETWTVNRSGTNLPADIAGDLTVNTATGGISGGTAAMRLIDGLVAYQFSGVSISSGTAMGLNLTGFTNTPTPGNITSTITTYTSTPTAVDSATSGTLYKLYTPPTADLTSTSVSMSSSVASATNVSYTITASSVTVSAIKCYAVDFMTTSDKNGVKPTNMSLTAGAGAALDASSTWILSAASWAVANGGVSGLQRGTYTTGTTPASSGGRTIVLDGITNPSVAGTYYAYVLTYGNTDCVSTPLDYGVIPFTVENNLAPNSPTSLAQSTVGGTSIPTGNWIGASSVKFSANVSDQNADDTDSLCVEAEPLGTSFTGATTCGSGVAYSGTSVPASVTISGLSTNSQYHWQAETTDGSLSSSFVSYGGNAESVADFGIDTSTPVSGTVYDGSNAGSESSFNNGSLSSLSCNWSGFSDAGSGMASYDYSFGTTVGGTDILGWTNVASSTTNVTASSLTLHTSQLYYCNVRAHDNAGNVSSAVSSPGQLVAPTLTFGISSNSATFAALSPANGYTNSQTLTLTTSTNAYNGYNIYAYETGPPTAGSNTISNYSAPASTPTTWSGYGFGYTVSGGAAASGFSSGTKYAHFGTQGSPDTVASHTSLVTGSPITNEQETVTAKVATSASQAAGTYTTSVGWSCVAIF